MIIDWFVLCHYGCCFALFSFGYGCVMTLCSGFGLVLIAISISLW